MRLAITSDIHTDKNGPEVEQRLCEHIARLQPDVLIVAGDIATGPAPYLKTLLALRAAARRVVVVAGNHDVWTTQSALAQGVSSWALLDQILPAICREAGVDYLDAGPVEIDGVGFVGTLGWYDLTMREHLLEVDIDAYRTGRFGGLVWMDHQFALWQEDGRTWAMEEVAEHLQDRLTKHLRQLSTRKIVAVTHMLAFEQQIHRKDHPGWRYANAFIGSTRLGQILQRDPRVALAIAGHTHHGSDLRIGRMRAVVSPLGYRGEWKAPDAAGAVAKAVAVVEI